MTEFLVSFAVGMAVGSLLSIAVHLWRIADALEKIAGKR